MNQAAPAKQPPPELITQLQMALKFQKDGMLSEADNAYKKALKDFPDFPDVNHLAAIFYEQIGKTKYAITLLNKALQFKKNDLTYLKLLANAHFKEAEFENALKHLEAAHALNPNDPETLYLIGICYYKCGSLSKAYEALEIAVPLRKKLSKHLQQDLLKRAIELALYHKENDRAIELCAEAEKDKLVDYDIMIRCALANKDNSKEAFLLCISAINSQPQRNEAKSILSYLCQNIKIPKIVTPQIEIAISACLKSNQVNHQTLAMLWIFDFFSNKHPEAVPLLACNTYEEFKPLYEAHSKTCFFEPYFIDSLRLIGASSFETEALYTHLRRFYLESLQAGKAWSNEEAILVAAMSIQCHLNEFVFTPDASETTYILALGEKLKGLETINESNIHEILLYSCYLTLRTLEKNIELKKFEKHAVAGEVIRVHISEPEEEIRLGKTIPVLSPIADRTSLEVQNQYEQNPYPRWNAPSIIRSFTLSFADQSVHSTKQILIAGCGTGRHIFYVKDTYPQADITAVDLSRASLSYAKRKLAEHNMDKLITLYQADILDLKKMGKTFDYIESVGVIHHMREPEKGLQVLSQILKKGGTIKLGLYSTLARKNVFMARDYIKEQGIESTPEGIRAAREYLKSQHNEEDGNRSFRGWRDFFSLSECRDLIFHVQEHTYTIPQIRDLLHACGLEFVRFDVAQSNIKTPIINSENTHKNNILDIWDAHENEHPDTFISMYQFTAVKK